MGCIILFRMKGHTPSPQFDAGRPVTGALEVVREVLFSPRAFYEDFEAGGPLRGAVVFVWLVSLVAAVLSMALAVVLDVGGGIDVYPLLVRAGEAAAFVVLSPLALGVVAAVYMVPVRVFVGKEARFRHLYRMLASAYSVMVLGWVPVLQSFAIVYGMVVLMALALRSVYRVPGLMALVVSVISLIPISAGAVWLILEAARLVSG
ncbi:hypothetical protein [Rubrobacter calidifluminis]|uniref:hypothetical protein n=1 Tax=Rubrobacter calidifluminis TaxID=1392640 RepID=UPI0023625D4F|nr:hypothetical protein [Rubrobacter calidifluminis]